MDCIELGFGVSSPGDEMMHGNDWFMGGMWLFWLVVLVGLVFLVRWVMMTGSGQRGTDESAEETLKRRYARGEMDRNEYEQKLQDLKR